MGQWGGGMGGVGRGDGRGGLGDTSGVGQATSAAPPVKMKKLYRVR